MEVILVRAVAAIHLSNITAVTPVPALDNPRFRSWDPEKIVPPGRWGVLQLGGGKRAKGNRN